MAIYDMGNLGHIDDTVSKYVYHDMRPLKAVIYYLYQLILIIKTKMAPRIFLKNFAFIMNVKKNFICFQINFLVNIGDSQFFQNVRDRILLNSV